MNSNYVRQAASQINRYHNHQHNGTTHQFLQLLNETILTPFGDICKANIITSGYYSLVYQSKLLVNNHSSNFPILFISCLGRNDTYYFKDFLEQIETIVIPTNDDNKPVQLFHHFLNQNTFLNGLIMITFVASFICFGSWMIYLILLLLPVTNHNSKRKLVHVYILASCIFESGINGVAIKYVYKPEYLENYEDPAYFERKIISSRTFKVFELLVNFLCCINWINIIYYMHHNSKRIVTKIIPFPECIRNNRNRFIVLGGLLLTLVDELFYTLLLTDVSFLYVSISYKIIEGFSYILFSSLVVAYIWHDFGYTLRPNHVQDKNRKLTFGEVTKILWRSYHSTVPLIIYNAIVILLLFCVFFFFVANKFNKFSWRYGILRFLKLLVTINTWGLIGVFERRASILGKETVLGRKIDNTDRFFVDPALDYLTGNEKSFDEETGNLDSGNELNTMNSSTFIGDERLLDQSRKSSSVRQLSFPKNIWSSSMKSMKKKKLYNTFKNSSDSAGIPFSQINSSSKEYSSNSGGRNGSENRLPKTKRNLSSLKNIVAKTSDTYRSNTSLTRQRSQDSNLEMQSGGHFYYNHETYEEDDENSSVETELTRNVLFNHEI
ncbi:hypothetical protein Kpol_495p19 [Vanderwaltozyma polyspora DSM 70294]|uniref:Protein DFG16 n=1 Tax=Vanderwaltozyma polyspora (strain ATCC 22028 / DSM 70294 / BCRC 21397 / CBS 2163 / NBRC 10782 / NRRL Y-8283 / UCD 57-17) TaxID=436907 RepID=A7TNZ6_VANPO|nr:uncharacterized protein Kpol_495p19 [Vanderwaltozyma polyspora DSM 70294]EDO16021.1 hypothetical protein Kpol_495p19 [Vanderwaltozyma polyspora DSM 70294]